MNFPLQKTATWAACMALLCLSGLAAQAQSTNEKNDFSAAEKLLFITNHLGALKLPTTLRYTFRRSGSLEERFEDVVSVSVASQADGKCCKGNGEFLTGPRRVAMPEVEGAEGNPVLMYFLEREVREMQRLTKGSQSHFRKQIRMALFNAAKVQNVTLSFRGKDVPGQEVMIAPYLEDPNRPRFEKLARKEYRFLLSQAVPGGVFGIRTRVDNDSDSSAPLLAEEMLIDGAQFPKSVP